jgi:hypothetical protein
MLYVYLVGDDLVVVFGCLHLFLILNRICIEKVLSIEKYYEINWNKLSSLFLNKLNEEKLHWKIMKKNNNFFFMKINKLNPTCTFYLFIYFDSYTSDYNIMVKRLHKSYLIMLLSSDTPHTKIHGKSSVRFLFERVDLNFYPFMLLL